MEKTVSVRLKMIHDQFVKAAAESGRAVDNVVKADKWKQLGQTTAGLGDTLTRNVTLPIIGVGVAATKMALDFDSVFVQMQSLAGATADEIDGMKEGVLELAGETGKAPKELAEALYFLRSSGLDASSAMDALEMSAKASAAGMGSTVQIADAVSSAMNAYAKSGLTAAQATDVMVATAREGKAEPAELARQMGGLLPVASELGITFNDVGASLAALSLSGNNAAAASTLLGNLMAKILKPSQQGAEALAAVGISYEDLRDLFSQGDMLGALETLRASLGDVGFSAFLEDKQAIDAGLALTGENVEKNREIFESLGDSVGATEQAFETWATSMGAKNAKAWAQFQTALIRLGDTLAPLATDLIGFASKLLEAFDKLPGPVKQLVAGLVIAAAAAGPLLSVGGRLISVWASLSKAFANMTERIGNNFGNAMADAMNQGAGAADGLNRKMGALQKAAGLAAGAAGVGAVLFAIHEFGQARKQAQIDKMIDDFMATGEAADSLAEAIEGDKFAMGDYAKAFEQLLDTNLAGAERWVDAAEAAGMEAEWVEKAREALEDKAKAEAQAADDSEDNAAAVEELTGAYDEETTAINLAVEALGKYADALTAQFDPLFGMLDASKGVRDARVAVEEATRKLSEAEKEHGKDSEEAAAAARDLADAHDDAVTAALGFEQAQITLAAAVENGDIKLGEAKTMLQKWVEAGHITQAEADVMAAKFDIAAGSVAGYSDEIEDVPGSTMTDVHVNTVAAREGIKTVHGDLNRLDRSSATVDVYVNVHGKTASELLAGYQIPGRAAGGPVWRGEGYMVGEKGPEWFEPEQNGRIIPNHMLSSNLVPQSAFMGGGGGGGVFVSVDMRGAIISSQADAQRWVATAWNKAAQRNLVSVRGRPL